MRLARVRAALDVAQRARTEGGTMRSLIVYVGAFLFGYGLLGPVLVWALGL